MIRRTMIIVAAGRATRFGSDKLMTQVNGRPLLTHTIEAVAPHVDQMVLVLRPELIREFEAPGLIVVPGGDTRTASEVNGVAASPPSLLIGIHDGARPGVKGSLIEALYHAAESDGGAVPGLEPDGLGIDNQVDHPTMGAVRVQTPQVFWGPELKAAYLAAARTGFTGPDTMAVIRQFTSLEVTVVPGDPTNIKVTNAADLAALSLAFWPESGEPS